MSSLPNQVTSPRRVGSPNRTKGSATEQVRESLHSHLRKTARFIKLMDTTVQIFAWIAGILVIWFSACVIDHWLVPLPRFARWLFWGVGVVGTLWWLTRFVLPLLFRNINLAYAAKRIEHLVPEFKNGLISWLQLEGMPEQGVPRGVMAALAYRAKHFIGGQDPSATVDTSPLIKLIGVVLLLTTVLVIYTIISPKSVGVTARRIMFPWESLAAPTRVELLRIEPGAAVVTQGKPLPVEVEVRGLRIGEPVFVRFTTTDGQLVNQSVELDAIAEGFKYAGNVATSGEGVQHEFDYFVTAGDAEAGPYHISLSPLPSVVLESVSLEFPAYTRLPPRVVSGGKVESPEGTTATISARANQAIKKGVLEVNPQVDDQHELKSADSLIDMQVADRQLQASMRLLLNDEGQNPTEVQYRIRGYNTRGDTNPRPIMHSLSVLADVGPEITLVGPENRLLRVLSESQVDLEVWASDPDFGLAQITMEVRKGGVLIGKTTLLDSRQGEIGRQVKTARLNLAKLRLDAGDRIQLLAIATDNRHDPQSGKLAPNRAESESLTLEVVGPNEPVDVPKEKPQPQRPDAPNPSDDEAVASDEQQSNSDNSAQTSGSDSNEGQGTEGAGNSAEKDSGQSGSQSTGSKAGDASQGDQPNGAAEASEGNSSQGSRDGGDSNGGQAEDGGESSPSQGDNGQGQAGQNASGQRANGQSRSGTSSGQSGNETGNGPSEDAEVIDRVRRFIEEQAQNKEQPTVGNPQTSAGQESEAGGQRNDESGGQTPQPGDNSGNTQQPGASSDDSASTEPNENNDPGAKGNDSASQAQASGQQTNESGRPSNDSDNQTQQSGQPESQAGESQKNDSNGQASESSSQGDPSQNESGQSGDQGQQSGSQGGQAGTQGQQSSTESGRTENQGQQSGNQGNESGSQGQQSGNQGNESGSQGQQSGSQSGQSESQGQQSGNQSGQTGSQGQQSGSQGNESGGKPGSQGSESASQANESGGKPGSQESESGSQPGGNSSQSGSQGDQAGSKESTGQQGGQSGGQSPGEGKAGTGQENQQNQSGSQGNDSTKPLSESANQGSQAGNQESQTGSQGTSSGAQSDSGGSSSGGSSESSAPPGQGPPSAQNRPGAQGGPGASTGGATGGSGSGAASGRGSEAGSSDAVNQDYAEKTTQMVLDYLNRQKDQPDPELLKQLDWSQQDLNEFVDRWKQARDLAVEGDEQDRLKWQEQLRDLGLRSPTQGARSGAGINDNFQQMQDSGTRSRPPEGLRKSWEAFRRAVESR